MNLTRHGIVLLKGILIPKGGDSLFELQRHSNYRKSKFKLAREFAEGKQKNCSNHKKITEVLIIAITVSLKIPGGLAFENSIALSGSPVKNASPSC